jgi:hypothetical protein
MAYRSPRYSYVHAAREVGADAITLSHAAHADFPVDNLIDDRAGTLFKFAGSASHIIDFDLGEDFDTGIDRIIIPANHNVEYLRVGQDDNDSYSSVDWLMIAQTAYPGTQFDHEFDSASTERYLRVILGEAQHYLPQIYLTKIVTIDDTAPNLANSVDQMRANVTRLVQPTGLLPTIQHGPQQREIAYSYEYGLEGTDLTAMEALIAAVGMHRPFYVDPAVVTPFTDEPALWMKFAEMPRVSNAIDVPMSNPWRKLYELSLIESLD